MCSLSEPRCLCETELHTGALGACGGTEPRAEEPGSGVETCPQRLVLASLVAVT